MGAVGNPARQMDDGDGFAGEVLGIDDAQRGLVGGGVVGERDDPAVVLGGVGRSGANTGSAPRTPSPSWCSQHCPERRSYFHNDEP